jgi:DNA-binding transcriptional LysR family regulator
MKKRITKEDLYHLNFITLNANSTIQNLLIHINTKSDSNKTIKSMQLNSIEGIKTAVSLGVGAAFVSSSAIEKEMELKLLRF